ncbi:PH domain leucine-rich repeat-containing protein phosphatase 2 isoform X1, partial [Tachysurus ichikawai]
RLDPSERPLQMVYDYLTTMGYDDPVRVQQEAANSDLSCMIRFYSGCGEGQLSLLGDVRLEFLLVFLQSSDKGRDKSSLGLALAI